MGKYKEMGQEWEGFGERGAEESREEESKSDVLRETVSSAVQDVVEPSASRTVNMAVYRVTESVQIGTSRIIRIAPECIEKTIASLKILRIRLEALDADKDKLAGDAGYMSEAMQLYDKTLSMIISQLKTLIDFTQEVLQKANSSFIEADEKMARGY